MVPLEPLDAAGRVVAERFPSANAAFLAGSVLTPYRSLTSDLDIVVVLAGLPAPYRETIREHGWVVELFVHSTDSLEHYWKTDLAGFRCTLARMCADGLVLRSVDGAAERIKNEARGRVEAGPPPVSREELDRRRYLVTDLLDDLRGATGPGESTYIASALLIAASELALLSEHRWLATGKWLARELSDSGGGLSGELARAVRALVADGDPQPLDDAVNSVLDRCGGPFTEGYHARGNVPPPAEDRRDQPVDGPGAAPPNPVTYFEIPVGEMDRAVRFYEAVFEVRLDRGLLDGIEMAWFPGRDGAPGIAGALARGDSYVPGATGARVYFNSENIDATLALAVDSGGAVLYPKTSIGELGEVAEFEDTEGNCIALHCRTAP